MSSTSTTGRTTSTRSVLKDFEKQYGIKVNYDVFDKNEVLETKLLTGHTGYDVVVPSAPFLERADPAGVLQKLDKAQLPNLKNLDPDVAGQRRGSTIRATQYAADYMWVTSGLGYNVQEIKERMPDAPRGQLADVLRSGGGLEVRGLRRTVLDAPSEVVGTVLLYLGKDPEQRVARGPRRRPRRC